MATDMMILLDACNMQWNNADTIHVNLKLSLNILI